MTEVAAPLEDLFDQAVPALAQALPDECFVAFHLTGDEGGDWALHRHYAGLDVSPRALATWDCRVTCTVEDFRHLVAGTLDARRGFLDGKLHVEGDVGLVLDMLRAIRTAA